MVAGVVVVALPALWLGTRGGDPVVLARGLVVLAALVPAITTLLFVLRAARSPRRRRNPAGITVTDLLS